MIRIFVKKGGGPEKEKKDEEGDLPLNGTNRSELEIFSSRNLIFYEEAS